MALREAQGRRLRPTLVLLDDVRSAHNVGLIFRLADTCGIRGLWLGGITPFPGRSERATHRIAKTAVGGSLGTVPWRHLPNPARGLRRLKRLGWRVTVVEQCERSTPWHSAPCDGKRIFVFGHERAGVRDSILRLADEIIDLPARGVTNSLNVALCAAIVLHDQAARDPQTV